MDCSTAVLCVVLLPSRRLPAPLVGAWQKQEQWFPGKLGRDWWEREREGENGGKNGYSRYQNRFALFSELLYGIVISSRVLGDRQVY